METKYFFDVDSNIKSLIESCMAELNLLQIPFSHSIYFRECGGTQTYGLCYYGKDYVKYREYEYVIAINRYLTSEIDIKETIIHELLHTINLMDGHRGIWKKYADYINNKTKYTIKRTDKKNLKQGAFYGQKKDELYNPQKFMTVQCPICKDDFSVRKATSVSKYGNTHYLCRTCNIYYYKFVPDSIVQNYSDEQKKDFIEQISDNFTLTDTDMVVKMLPFLNQSLRDYLLMQLFIKQTQLCVSKYGCRFIDPLMVTCSKNIRTELADMYIMGEIEYLKNITEDEFIYFSFYFSLTKNYVRVQDYWVSLGNRRV